MKRRALAALAGAIACGMAMLGSGPALAIGPAKKAPVDVVLGLQTVGTASWEIKVIKDLDLDKDNGINLVVKDMAGKQAGHVALLARDVDVILTDFLWVAMQRANGEQLTMVPHSKAVGGLMVHPDSPVTSLEDLPGSTIAIAGGPLDKSWIALQAFYAQQTGSTLADNVTARFGAPPLVKELLIDGKVDAALNFWHFNARSKSEGMAELIPVSAMMSGMGIDPQPPLLGWTFRDKLPEKKREGIVGFLNASFAAKKHLLTDDAVWETLRANMRAEDDDALFMALRDDYRKGIIESYDNSVTAAAAASYEIMAKIGGPDLVGSAPVLPDGTFWSSGLRYLSN